MTRNRIHARTAAICAAGVLLTLYGARAIAQRPDELTVDRIFAQNEFYAPPQADIHWLGNEGSYVGFRAAGQGSELYRTDVTTGRSVLLVDASALVGENRSAIDVEDLQLSEDHKHALLYHSSERVWRENTRGLYHVLDLATRKLTAIASGTGPIMFAKLSPDARETAYVRQNNIFVTDLPTGTERPLTSDGSETIINGTGDWVYEEEYDLRDGFRWSPDGRYIAFWRLDQSRVPEFTLLDQSQLYPAQITFRYPKAGQPNSVVKIGMVEVATGKTTWVNLGSDSTIYVNRLSWVGSDSIALQRVPRRQNRVDYLMASASDGGTRLILSDSDSAYVEASASVITDPVWIEGNTRFLWTTDRTGWRQVFVYDRSGRVIRQLTIDGADVTGIAGVDARNGDVYVQVAAPHPMQRSIVRYSLKGGRGAPIASRPGTYSMSLSQNGRYAVVTYSSINVPPITTIYSLPSLRAVRVLTANDTVKMRLDRLNIRPAEFFRLPAADGATMLDAYRIVPTQFDSTRRYPVLMYVYGGPGGSSTTVNDAWMGNRFMWHHMLAQKGYVVVSVDNRGAAWRGRGFRKAPQSRLGVLESDDQIAAARWIAQQRWADPSRIGIWGWSYGGYMTLMSTLRGGDVFRTGMSVAPVTDWRLYDTIYTERFMWTPAENTAGYNAAAPLNYVRGLTANLLVVHGTADDNVHVQNSLQLARALQLARKPFSFMLYPNKTHSISGAGGTLHIYDTLTRFVLDNL